MKRSVLLYMLLCFLTLSCNKDEKKTQKYIEKTNELNKLEDIENIKDSSDIVLEKENLKLIEDTSQPKVKNISRKLNTNSQYINSNLNKILETINIGETRTNEELIKREIVPKEAIKIIKSITKISENELAIQWKSKWLIEKISDVKFEDGSVKFNFTDNILYTSGNAIGIKHKGKIHHNLKIIKNKAYIEGVKEYCWRIGK